MATQTTTASTTATLTEPVCYTVFDLVRITRISLKTLRGLIAQGHIPGLMRLGRQQRFLKSVVDDWMRAGAPLPSARTRKPK